MNHSHEVSKTFETPAEVPFLYLPYDFTEHVLTQPRDATFPISNDAELFPAYEVAVEHLPEPSPGTSGVVLLVGNGSFETASKLFPPELPIIFCDIDATTLLVQRVIIEALEQCNSPEDFKRSIDHTGYYLRRTLAKMGASKLPDTDFVQLYTCQFINGWSGEDAEHFLDSDEAYMEARAATAIRSYGFALVNLANQYVLKDFGERLAESGLSIVCANVTNVFDNRFAGVEGARHAKQLLPFAPGAQIISSTTKNHLIAQTTPLEKWAI